MDIFNTVTVVEPEAFNECILKDLKYGGFLTISQSGQDLQLIKALRLAYLNNLTCFNIVNSENSPITKVIDEI